MKSEHNLASEWLALYEPPAIKTGLTSPCAFICWHFLYAFSSSLRYSRYLPSNLCHPAPLLPLLPAALYSSHISRGGIMSLACTSDSLRRSFEGYLDTAYITAEFGMVVLELRRCLSLTQSTPFKYFSNIYQSVSSAVAGIAIVRTIPI